jgi:glycosyltransferase involved in cell wall biosynthesis
MMDRQNSDKNLSSRYNEGDLTVEGNKVSIIVPAYNEENSIKKVLENLKKKLTNTGTPHDIIVVDDGSTDRTKEIAQDCDVRVLTHPKNKGYGAAIKTGMRYTENDTIVITDADGTYPADAIGTLIEHIKDYDMVVGARKGKNVNIPLVRRPAKWLLNKLAEYITGTDIDDLNSGLRVFRKSLVQQYLNILPEKFSFTTTITVAMLCDDYDIKYVPIDYHRREGRSKIVSWDFINFVTLVLRMSMLFNPLKVFIPLALMGFFLGCVKFVFDLIVSVENSGGLNIGLITQLNISSSTIILWLAALQIILVGMVADGLIRKLSCNAADRSPYKDVKLK